MKDTDVNAVCFWKVALVVIDNHHNYSTCYNQKVISLMVIYIGSDLNAYNFNPSTQEAEASVCLAIKSRLVYSLHSEFQGSQAIQEDNVKHTHVQSQTGEHLQDDKNSS